MKFSNKVKYGLQFMLFLTIDTEEYTDILRAALSCEVPHKFLETIASDLRKAELLTVKRGAGGGYKLSKQPDLITFYDIFKALTKKEKKSESTQNSELTSKVADIVINNAKKTFEMELKKISLLDIRKVYMDENEKIMYYI